MEGAVVTAETPSPRGVLGRLRRNRGETHASDSRNGSSVDLASNLDASECATLSSGVEVPRSRSVSIDERRGGDEPSSNRVASLLSRAKVKKKRKGADSTLIPGAGSRPGSFVLDGNLSASSLLPDESGRSSLLTDDNSDHERDGRPPLATRDSHAGYLTLSSPDVNCETHPAPSETRKRASSDLGPHTFPVPQILEPSDAPINIDLSPQGLGAVRADRPASGNSASLKKQNSEPISTKPIRASKGLGALFGSSSRRNSVDTRGLGIDSEGIPAALSKSESLPEGLKHIPHSTAARAPGSLDTTSIARSTPLDLTGPPNTVVTPPTPITAAAPFSIAADLHREPPTPASQKGSTHGRLDSIRHRRGQSVGLPSKLSNPLYAALTPPIEETKTPGGTLIQPTPSSGFFSSVFSVAQKAADQLTNGVNGSLLPFSRPQAAQTKAPPADGNEAVTAGSQSTSDFGSESRPLAVTTLGKGNLSLSHLGITEHREALPMNSAVSLLQQGNETHGAEAGRKAEQDAAARAVSSAYEKAAGSGDARGRPASIASNDPMPTVGEQTPPRHLPDLDQNLLKRSGSNRSKLSGKARRHRASSATAGTVNSVAAAIKDSASGLANPSANGQGHRLTGFAVASSKRNRDFHQLFRSVPEDDYLIEDYSAALQRDILLHGRLYVSEGHICFSSNILGWVTNLVISFDEVVSVEKKSTAVIFPNALVISTHQARNTFASFVARDSTYELLIGIWKISHPNLKSSLNGVMLDDAGTGDKTEVADPEGSDVESDDGTEDEVYDEDADDDGGSYTDAGGHSRAASEAGELPASRKASANPAPFPPFNNGSLSKSLDNADISTAGPAASSDGLGPATHAPTECSDVAEHYDRPLVDLVIPAPLGKIYSLMFGPSSGAFMRKFLVDDQKSRELSLTDDKVGMDSNHKTLSYNYIKPLNGPVGPKQTKCITTCTLTAFDLEKAVCVDCSTQTPDVPNGNVFTVRTRYCLMWGANNSTRLIATCTIEWSGKSWLRSVIDKASTDGQTEYVNSLVNALRAAITSKAPGKATGRKGRRKGKQEGLDAEEAKAKFDAAIAAESKASSWGAFEPLHIVLSSIMSVVRPFVTPQVVIAVLFVLLAYTWLFPLRTARGIAQPGHTSPELLVAYEEMWRREESALWDWLHDRVGLDDVYAPHGRLDKDKQSVLQARSIGRRLSEQRMDERQLDDAIRTTEERLSALKDAVQRKKSRQDL